MDVSIYTPNKSFREFPFSPLSLQHTLFVDFFSNGHSDQGELISPYMRLYCLAQWCAQLLSHVQLFSTPWTAAQRALLSMEFSRKEHWSGLLFPTPGNLPNPGSNPRFLHSQADSLPLKPPGKLQRTRLNAL